MGRIKPGICLKSLGLPFRRSLPAAHKLGASAIELEAAGELQPQSLTQTGRREITHLLRSHDLAVSAIVCPLRHGIDVALDLEPRLQHIRDTMALAFDLGPRLVIIPVGKLPSPPRPPQEGSEAKEPEDPTFPIVKEALLDLGRHGDRTGVTIALDSGVDSPETLVAYLNLFDVGSLAVNYNPANLVLAGQNAYDAVKTYRKRLAHAHAQDARRISPSRVATVPVGHGDIDWMQLLATFEEIEYRGYLTVLGNDGPELGAGLAFLRRFVA